MTFIQSELALLVQWMFERDRIRSQKARGLPRPWTTDPPLRDFRWCNVRRMDDRVSVALLQRWYTYDADPHTAIVAATLARLVNWPASLMEVSEGLPFQLHHLHHVCSRLTARAERGDKVFTGAYVVPGVPGWSKVDSVCELVFTVSRKVDELIGYGMKAIWGNLIKLDGLGSFLAGQIVADMAHLQVGVAWPDPETWAPIGPGSARGINRLLGRPKDQSVSQAQFEEELPALMEVLYPLVRPLWDDRQLQAMDIQNCLCEFDKYRRLQLGEGKVRARYDGAGANQGGLFA